MLLLLLLLLSPRDNDVKRYFSKCKYKKDKDQLLANISDEFTVDHLKELTDLFLKQHFHSNEIKKFVKRQIDETVSFDLALKTITGYQKQFYHDILTEYNEFGKCDYYDEAKNNKSFRFVTTEDESDLELRYMDLYYEANKKDMSEKGKDEFMLKRIMKAAFPDKKGK
jgi:hypothetical protein